jgi:hypothetical protein
VPTGVFPTAPNDAEPLPADAIALLPTAGPTDVVLPGAFAELLRAPTVCTPVAGAGLTPVVVPRTAVVPAVGPLTVVGLDPVGN